MLTAKHDFDGRLVVVTGGTGALGSAVVERLLGCGARVRVPVFDPRELEGSPFVGDGRVATVEGVDLSEPEAVEAFYAPADGLFASIHVAGGFAMGKVAGADQPEAFARMMRMNAHTADLCSRRAVIAMAGSAEGGRIVNTTARPGLIPREGGGMVPYATSKAAVAAMTEALAREVASQRIWVNAVAPSILDNEANREAMPDADHDAWPKPDQLAETMVFLASPANRVTTGGIVPVYGSQ
ncbi:MAG: SDR family NAD(P)-dependent oxidoreductase [Planctomycetota bacterium]